MRQTARDRDAAEEMRSRRRSKADDMVYDEQKRGNRQIFIITYFFVALFLGMMVYITVFMVRDSADIINNSYKHGSNTWSDESHTIMREARGFLGNR